MAALLNGFDGSRVWPAGTPSDMVSASLRGSFSVTAVAGEFPVTSFGAKGDGKTDDTAAIQSAINAASAAGGGSVVLSVARYFTAGRLVVPQGVLLSGGVFAVLHLVVFNDELSLCTDFVVSVNRKPRPEVQTLIPPRIGVSLSLFPNPRPVGAH
jgi:hypothetical protein